MRALAWDDEPHLYLEPLKQHLEVYGIILEITSEPSEFLRRFRVESEKWDFIVTDIFSPDPPATPMDSPRVGLRIAKLGTQAGLPVFVITKHVDKAEALGLLSGDVIVKSKSTYVEWTADEIHQELSRRGLIVDRRKVFLIYGRDGKAMGAREKLDAFLKRDLGLKVEGMSAVNLKTEIAQGLLSKMNGCAAFVALCTPDDPWDDGTRHPRQNVMLEIGIALGLSRGLDRLSILQRIGPGQQPELNAQLPSDLHGIVTLRFYDKIEDIFPDLKQRLRELGVEILKGASAD